MSLVLLSGALSEKTHKLGIPGQVESRWSTFLRDSAVDAEVDERSSQRLSSDPGYAPPVTGDGHDYCHEPAVCWALARSARQTPSIRMGPNGIVHKGAWSNQSIACAALKRREMRSVRAPTSHLPDVMVVDLAVRSIITMVYLHACSPHLQHLFFSCSRPPRWRTINRF